MTNGKEGPCNVRRADMRSGREPARHGRPASVRGHAVGGPDWLGGSDWLDGGAEGAGKRRDGSDWLNGGAEGAAEMRSGGRRVNNSSESTPPCRSLKGFRVRKDYQQRHDVLWPRGSSTRKARGN